MQRWTKSNMSELQKTAKPEPKDRRRRLQVRALHTDDGNIIHDPAEMGASLERQWARVFEQLPAGTSSQDLFLEHVVPFVDAGDRERERGSWRESLQGVPGSALGPDGFWYSFWASAPPDWSALLDRLADHMASGHTPPQWLLESKTSFIPKALHTPHLGEFTFTPAEM